MICSARIVPDEAPLAPLVDEAGGDEAVRVPVGEAFCADGVITQGSTRVDEALLTGESAPVDKALGDAVVAGRFVQAARLSGWTTAIYYAQEKDTAFHALG